jgi:streptogramin lyase
LNITVSSNINNNKNNSDNSSHSNEIQVKDLEYPQRDSLNNTNYPLDEKQIPIKYIPHLCGSSFEKISDFIVEYSIPVPCSQPVGIAIDNKPRAWIAATWVGYLLIFDPKINYFSDFIKNPNWKTEGLFGSMVWEMDFDKNGDLWFTDQENNAIWRYFVDEKKNLKYI